MTILSGERLILDPAEVADERTEFDLTPFVAAAGPDFGDAAITAYLADAGKQGQRQVDYTMPNRVVTIPLVIMDRAGTDFETVRTVLQQKVGLWMEEGGWLKRDTTVGAVYATVVGAQLKFGGSTTMALYEVDQDAVLTLTCTPEWVGDEIQLDSMTSTGYIAGVLEENGGPAVIKGDIPGRCRIVVTEGSSQDQRGLFGGFRSRHSDVSATAGFFYEAEALTPISPAVVGTMAGTSGGRMVGSGDVGTNWRPLLGTDIQGVGPMTHRGSYRVMARVYTTIGDSPLAKLRFAWSVGGAAAQTIGPSWEFPSANGFYVADLGSVRLDAPPMGTHFWRGTVQVQGASGTPRNAGVDCVWLVPLDEAEWSLSAPQVVQVGMNPMAESDNFDTVGALAALNGRTPVVGSGTWSSTGAGNDFVGTGTGAVRRISTSDSGWRLALLPTSMANTAVGVDFWTQGYPPQDGAFQPAVVFRYVDANNYMRWQFWHNAGVSRMVLVQRLNNVDTWLGSVVVWDVTNTWLTMNVSASPNGQCAGWLSLQNGAVLWSASGQSSALATGGALASGKVGFIDYNANAVYGFIRDWDNFYAYDPTASGASTTLNDAVMFAGKHAQLRDDGCYTEADSGGAYGPVTIQTGDLPRIPPSGAEGRKVELLLKNSRGDLDTLPDSGLDAMTAQVIYRPSYLYVGEPIAVTSGGDLGMLPEQLTAED